MANTKTLNEALDAMLINGQKLSPEVKKCITSAWKSGMGMEALYRLEDTEFAAREDKHKHALDTILPAIKKEGGLKQRDIDTLEERSKQIGITKDIAEGKCEAVIAPPPPPPKKGGPAR